MRGIKKLYGIAILLAILISTPAHLYAAGGNIDAELPSNNGSDAFQVKDNSTPDKKVLLHVNSSGNVGIGTTNPNVWFNAGPVLHIEGLRPIIRLSPTGIDKLATIAFKDFNSLPGTSEEMHLNYSASATDPSISIHSYLAGSQDIFTIKGNGNVGIGTTTPAYKLDVAGDLRVSSNATFTSTDLYGYAQFSSQVIFVPGAPNEYKWVQIPYLEGVPFRFNVYRGVHEDGTWYGQLAATISSTTGSWGSLAGNVFVQVEKAEYPVFLLGQIGYLEASGNTADNGIYLNLLAGRNYHFYGAPGGIQVKDFDAVTAFASKWSKALPFDINAANGASTMTGGRDGGLSVMGNGNVGIGITVPSSKLDVAGDLKVSGSALLQGVSHPFIRFISGGDYRWEAAPDGAFYLYDQTNSAYRLIVAPSSGNIGIGTPFPGYKLDVAGSINAPSLCISGDCRSIWPTGIGASWPDITNKPAGFADNVDDVGITTESDPTVPASVKDGIVWTEVGGIPAGFADGVDNETNYWTASGGNIYNNYGAKVGIGTSSPVYTLEVHGTANTDSEGTIRIYKPIAPALILDSDGNDFRIVTSGSTSGNGSLRIDRGTSGGGLFTTYSPDFAIGPDGNVGIGFTNPDYKLKVQGNAANTTGVWANISDARLKKDVTPLENSLTTILRLQGVSFRWIDPEKDKEFGLMRGFIAQDVETVIPEWVNTGADGYKHLEKVGVEAILVEAIKELKAQKDSEIEELRTKNKELEARINELEKILINRK